MIRPTPKPPSVEHRAQAVAWHRARRMAERDRARFRARARFARLIDQADRRGSPIEVLFGPGERGAWPITARVRSGGVEQEWTWSVAEDAGLGAVP